MFCYFYSNFTVVNGIKYNCIIPTNTPTIILGTYCKIVKLPKGLIFLYAPSLVIDEITRKNCICY